MSYNDDERDVIVNLGEMEVKCHRCVEFKAKLDKEEATRANVRAAVKEVQKFYDIFDDLYPPVDALVKILGNLS